MAHANGTSSLTRTRSVRAPANISKPAQHPSRGGAAGGGSSLTTTTTTATATATATATTTGPSLPAPSNLSLFLTNLRLLDLDQRPDWPDISASTFSASTASSAAATAQGGQKRRIQAVEWALYHLFALWDPDEARAKLQPFFPPLDQVQSLNLRAALLRALEQAKKAGALGRDAVVRRTMLDECKGERLEEVLAVLSSAVLKKVVAEGLGGYPALAQVLALENRGYKGERAELAALVLAHKVSLRRVLDEKNAARARFREFSDVLAEKQEEIARRRVRAEAAAKQDARGNALSEDQKAAVCRTVQNNWTGNERWVEALLYGDSKAHKDGLLSAPFDRVWRRVQSGRLAELEDHSVGLLEQLESRVRGQQARLEKWQGFRQRMFGISGSETVTKESQSQPKHKGIDLGFRAHQDLQLGRMSPRKLSRANPRQLDSHYKALINGLKSDLASAGQADSRIPAFFQRPRQAERLLARTTEDPNPSAEEISDISDLEESPPLPRPSPSRREPIRVSEEPAFEPVLRKAKTFDDDHAYPDDMPLTPSRLRRSATIQSQANPAAERPAAAAQSPTRPLQRRQTSAPKVNLNPRRPTSPPRGASPRSPPRRAPAPELPPPASPEPPPSPSPDPSPPSPTRQLADQILASVSAASPSPVKNRKPRHTLSLAERTRLSMARRTSRANLRDDEEDDDKLKDDEDEDEVQVRGGQGEQDDWVPLSVPTIAEPTPPEPGTEAEGAGQGAGYEDLVARTRRSMAGFEAARQRAQLERRRSVRRGPVPVTPGGGNGGGGGARGSSYFPAVDEEEGESTLRLTEQLLMGGHEDDYEAVFKSRPKLKSSPVGTPVRELWDD